MKTRKINLLFVLLAGFALLSIQSCRKYPDGPLISLRSRAERVANTWRVDNYIKNGTDYSSLMVGYTETYTRDGNYSYSSGSSKGTGIWNFQDDDREIELIGISHLETRTLTILKLEEKEFWYYYIDGKDKKEFHMVQD